MKTLGSLLAAFGRLYPFTRGRQFYFRNFVKKGLLGRALGALENPVRMRGGFVMHTYRDDFISLWLRMWGEYETETVRKLDRLLPEGQVLLDAGANLGVISLGLAMRRPDARFCCFECNPQTLGHLQASVRDNGLEERVRVFPVGLSDRADTLEFRHDAENTGASSLVGGSGGEGTVKVPVVRLDEYADFADHLRERGWRVGCVKMDIQGAEHMALSGMREILAEHRPALVVELDDEFLRQFGSSEQELRELIVELGYRIVEEFEGNALALPQASGERSGHE